MAKNLNECLESVSNIFKELQKDSIRIQLQDKKAIDNVRNKVKDLKNIITDIEELDGEKKSPLLTQVCKTVDLLESTLKSI